MKSWTKPDRPAEVAERRVIEAILEGDFPPHSTLPGERDLASQLGVTRPTLREALQRLSRDGWVEIRHGRPTRIKDYWLEGSLGVLKVLAQYPEEGGRDWLIPLWRVRAALTPAITQAAVEGNPEGVVRILQALGPWPESALEMAVLDWRINYQLSVLSGNPIFTMMLNSMAEAWIAAAHLTYTRSRWNVMLEEFRKKLIHVAESGDGLAAYQVSQKAVVDLLQALEEN